jgi:hypothetical protein
LSVRNAVRVSSACAVRIDVIASRYRAVARDHRWRRRLLRCGYGCN